MNHWSQYWQHQQAVWADWLHFNLVLQAAVLTLCLVFSGALVRVLRHRLQPSAQSVWWGQAGVDGVFFPLLLLLCSSLARWLMQEEGQALVLFRLALPIIGALVVIRLGVKVLQAAFRKSALVRVLERSISWLAWGVMVLWLSGLLTPLLDEMDHINWKWGNAHVSLRTLIEAGITVGIVMILTLWLSAALESRLLRTATGNDLSLRKAVSNAVRSVLLFLGLLLALSSAGIDLTALSVVGGALGVGIGFGLQKLAANYVSGFVILAERGVRIGDLVRIDGFEGRVRDIKTRYTVIRDSAGREALVPNESLITQRVENLSLLDSQLAQNTTVVVAHGNDTEQVMALLHEAVLSPARVLKVPEPSVALSAFVPDGLEFTVIYWLADPHNGMLNLKSEVNLAIWRALRQAHIEMPQPPRVVRQVAASAG